MNRILFAPEEVDRPLPRNDARAQHMLSVLGVEVGDTVEVGVVNGARGSAAVDAITDTEVRLEFALDPSGELDQPYPVTILLGHPRPNVLKRILKDLTTLGVERIVVARTDTGEKSYLDSNIWNGSAVRDRLVEGASQAGVTYIPEVDKADSLLAGLEFLESQTQPTDDSWNLQLVAMDNQPFHTRFSSMVLKETRVVLAVGSERGWSDRERIQLRDYGFVLRTMGPRVLRTETAVIAATALALAKIGYV